MDEMPTLHYGIGWNMLEYAKNILEKAGIGWNWMELAEIGWNWLE